MPPINPPISAAPAAWPAPAPLHSLGATRAPVQAASAAAVPSERTYPTSAAPRRRWLAGMAALIAFPALHRSALAQALLRPTPAQTEGPFYPLQLPADTDFDLLVQGATRYTQGEALWLDGSVRDLRGAPLRDAAIEIWQSDAHGHYHHPGDGNRADRAFQGFGRVVLGPTGEYRFHTIKPVPYTGRTPHIHVKVRSAQGELLTTQLYVEGDPGNERDGLWRRLDGDERRALTVPFERTAEGWRARFAIVVRDA